MLALIIGILEAVGIVGGLYFLAKGAAGGGGTQVSKFIAELEVKEGYAKQINELYDQMMDLGTLREKAEEYKAHVESLKAERGRITITQAELETVESRLRELEEIERELEASGIETKEEVNILTKKREELIAKNGKLKADLEHSMSKMDEIMSEIEISSQVEEQVTDMKSELIQVQEKIDVLLEKIELGNEQYFILKRRYDALDIEYAQLYEKFSAAEMALASNSGDEE